MFILRPHSPPPHKAVSGVRAGAEHTCTQEAPTQHFDSLLNLFNRAGKAPCVRSSILLYSSIRFNKFVLVALLFNAKSFNKFIQFHDENNGHLTSHYAYAHTMTRCASTTDQAHGQAVVGVPGCA
eukprot:6260116-Prymnesium_polylepis.2